MLVTCPDCDAAISSIAVACPKCGRPNTPLHPDSNDAAAAIRAEAEAQEQHDRLMHDALPSHRKRQLDIKHKDDPRRAPWFIAAFLMFTGIAAACAGQWIGGALIFGIAVCIVILADMAARK